MLEVLPRAACFFAGALRLTEDFLAAPLLLFELFAGDFFAALFLADLALLFLPEDLRPAAFLALVLRLPEDFPPLADFAEDLPLARRDLLPERVDDLPPEEDFLLPEDFEPPRELLLLWVDLPELPPLRPEEDEVDFLPAVLPATAPSTPPTTAPIGPAMLPRTAPAAAPAASFEIDGICRTSADS